MKYVIGYDTVLDYILPVVFPEDVPHIHVAALLKMNGAVAISAGFVTVDTPEIQDAFPQGGPSEVIIAEERSESTGLGPADCDKEILTYFLLHGLSGLSLKNMLTVKGWITASKFAELQKAAKIYPPTTIHSSPICTEPDPPDPPSKKGKR